MSEIVPPIITEAQVRAVLRNVIDPELGLSLVDLGLIYAVRLGPEGQVEITMTLTAPHCPLHATFQQSIERALRDYMPGLSGVTIRLVWDPPWHPGLISADGRRVLGLD